MRMQMELQPHEAAHVDKSESKLTNDMCTNGRETQRQGHWRGQNVYMLTQDDPLVPAERWDDLILPEHLWEGQRAAS